MALSLPGSGGALTAGVGVVAGAAVAGGAVAAVLGVKSAKERLMEKYVSAEHKAQIQVVYSNVQEHLSDYLSPEVIDGYKTTRVELMVLSPAFPQVKQAFDAIRSYQNTRTGGGVTGCACVSRRAVTDSDPETIVCELLKAWLQTKSEDMSVPPQEVERYRNFCRSFVAEANTFRQVDRYSFIEMLSHVATHLDSLLQLRLRQRQDCAICIKRLHKEAYNFALHATKVLLLAPTTFEFPKEMYSTDSLELLRKTALAGYQLEDKFEKHIGEDLEKYWSTDCGRIVSRILGSPHGVSLCASMDGRPSQKLGRQVEMFIQCATGLPSSWIFLRAEARVICPRGKTICRGRTEIDRTGLAKNGDGGKVEWNQTLHITIPNDDEVTVLIELTGVVSGACLQTKLISGTKVYEYAKQSQDVWLPMDAVSGASDDNSSLNPTVLVCFGLPTVNDEIQSVQTKWAGQNPRRTPDFSNSGLVSKKFGQAFLKAATELDGFIYFTDILLSQCLDLAQLLGDLGMVLSVDMIRPLLDEIQSRVVAVNQAVHEELLNEVYSRITSKHRERSWHLFALSTPEISPLVPDSSLKLQRLKTQLLEDVDSLRLACCVNYGTAADVLMEAKAVVAELLSRLTHGDTHERSERFGLLPKIKVVKQLKLEPARKLKLLGPAVTKSKSSFVELGSPASVASAASTRTEVSSGSQVSSLRGRRHASKSEPVQPIALQAKSVQPGSLDSALARNSAEAASKTGDQQNITTTTGSGASKVLLGRTRLSLESELGSKVRDKMAESPSKVLDDVLTPSVIESEGQYRYWLEVIGLAGSQSYR